MQGKATSKDFAHLDSLFVTHRNPKAIQQMQQKVVDYEQALATASGVAVTAETHPTGARGIEEAFGEIKTPLSSILAI